MNKIYRLLGGMLMLAVSGLANTSDHSTNITFGIYTTDRPSTLIRQFSPILKEMEVKMEEILGENVTIDIKITKTYSGAIQLLADGTFDVVRFGPVSYITAKEMNDGIQIVALESIGGNKEFYGIIAVREHSNIKSISDLNGAKFAFGNKSSTIGRYLAQQFLMDNGINEGSLSEFAFLDRHDAVGRAVASGAYDAGALKENTFGQLLAEGYPLKELARFPNVTKPWLASPKVSKRVVDAMTEALLTIDDPKILARAKIDGFLVGDDSDYDVIRNAISRNFLFYRP